MANSAIRMEQLTRDFSTVRAVDRLSDRVILFGKIAVPVCLAWLMTLLTLFLSLIIVNVTNWEGQLIHFSSNILLINILLSLIMAILMASVGVILSLKASTVQDTTQTLMASTMFPLILLQIGGLVVLQMKRDWLDNIMEFFGSVDATYIILIIGVVLIALCAVFLRITIARLSGQG